MRLAATLAPATVLIAPPALAEDGAPEWLRDRGTGVPTSMFATWVEPGEL
jgi:hypothetical protein